MHDLNAVAIAERSVGVKRFRDDFEIALDRNLSRLKLKMLEETPNVQRARDFEAFAIDRQLHPLYRPSLVLRS